MERLIFQPKDLTKKQKPKSEQAEKIRFLQLINRITSPTTKLTDWDIKGFLKGGAPKRPTETDNQNNQPTWTKQRRSINKRRRHGPPFQ